MGNWGHRTGHRFLYLFRQLMLGSQNWSLALGNWTWNHFGSGSWCFQSCRQSFQRQTLWIRPGILLPIHLCMTLRWKHGQQQVQDFVFMLPFFYQRCKPIAGHNPLIVRAANPCKIWTEFVESIFLARIHDWKIFIYVGLVSIRIEFNYTGSTRTMY